MENTGKHKHILTGSYTARGKDKVQTRAYLQLVTAYDGQREKQLHRGV